jgi:hypothetical protein
LRVAAAAASAAAAAIGDKNRINAEQIVNTC